MRSRWISRLLPAVLVVGFAVSAHAQSFAWWKSEPLQKEIGLTPEQIGRIESVVQGAMPKLREGKQDLDKQEAELSRLIETNADEALVIKQIDHVEAIRASLNKTRTLMLLRERQIMTPEQRIAFKASYERGRRGPDGDRRPDGPRRPDGDRQKGDPGTRQP